MCQLLVQLLEIAEFLGRSVTIGLVHIALGHLSLMLVLEIMDFFVPLGQLLKPFFLDLVRLSEGLNKFLGCGISFRLDLRNCFLRSSMWLF